MTDDKAYGNGGGRPDADAYFMRMARLVATRSTCLRRAVGCVLVDDHNVVLSTGYNGVARGAAHCNERRTRWLDGEDRGAVYPNACAGAGAASGVDLDACEAIHAEQNALVQCRDVGSVRACYVTVLPCVSCAKLLLSTGCRRVVYAEDYPQREAVERLLLCVGRMTTKRMEGE